GTGRRSTAGNQPGGAHRHRRPLNSRKGNPMPYVWIIVAVVVLTLLLSLAIRVVKQYEQGVLFRLGRVIGVRKAGLTIIIPFVDVLHRMSLRIITMPIQSQGIITLDN